MEYGVSVWHGEMAVDLKGLQGFLTFYNPKLNTYGMASCAPNIYESFVA
jgi:hypothetical protein